MISKIKIFETCKVMLSNSFNAFAINEIFLHANQKNPSYVASRFAVDQLQICKYANTSRPFILSIR